MARSRFLRDPGVSVLITARDDAMLKILLRVKYARVGHFQSLFFSSYKTAAERCMKLYHAKLMDRVALPARRGQAAVVHTIAAAGINRLREIGEAVPREWRAKGTSPTSLDHDLAVTDVLVSFLSGAGGDGPFVRAYERANNDLVVTLPQGSSIKARKPDAAVVVDHNGSRLVALIEVDRATMSTPQMHEKLLAYREAALARVGIEEAVTALLLRHGVPLVASEASVKLLVTVPSARRAVQLADIAVGVGLKSFVLLAVHDDLVNAGIFAPVWKSALAWVQDADGAGGRLVG